MGTFLRIAGKSPRENRNKWEPHVFADKVLWLLYENITLTNIAFTYSGNWGCGAFGGDSRLKGTRNLPSNLSFCLHDCSNCCRLFYQMIRDGPLEKLWGGREFSSLRNFFRYQIPCMNFFKAIAWIFFRINWRAWIFFHLIFPCANIFFMYFVRPSPPPHKFSNGPSLTCLYIWTYLYASYQS